MTTENDAQVRAAKRALWLAGDVSTEIAWRNFCEAMSEFDDELRMPNKTKQHVLVIGGLLVLIGVMIWASYFGPLS